jgi:hypothetical protein
MKNTKKLKTFSIYAIISFFTLMVIFFFSGAKKIITIYEIKNNFTENRVNINFFEDLFNFKLKNLAVNTSELGKFYFDIATNYNHQDYRDSMSDINNFFELFNNNLKKELTINSFNSQVILKSYSSKNIPGKMYEVKIISNNAEDAQKFFEKNVSKNIEILNNKILETLYNDYINKKTKDIMLGRSEINRLISIFENCQAQRIDSSINLLCHFFNDITLLDKNIKILEDAGSSLIINLNKSELTSANFIKLSNNDYFYKRFVKIHKKENIDYISFSKIFILYLLSLILVWILIFKTNYLNLLLKNKLFKFPK